MSDIHLNDFLYFYMHEYMQVYSRTLYYEYIRIIRYNQGGTYALMQPSPFVKGFFFYLLRSKLAKISEEKPLTQEDVVQPTNHQTKRTTCLKYFLFTEYRSRLNKKRKFEIGKIQSWTFQYILLMPLQKCHLKETPQPFAQWIQNM